MQPQKPSRPPPDKLTIPPAFWQHDEAYRRMYGKRFFALFADMGTAKTYMLLRDFLAMWQADLVDGLLVVAPSGVHEKWITRELPSITSMRCETAFWPNEPPLSKTSRPRIFTIYPEAFRRTDRVFKLVKKYLNSGRIGLVIDESQMLMSARSKTTKRVRALKPLASYRRVASGFPAPKGQIDYYPQYSFLSTTILRCTRKSHFVERYCEMGGFRGKAIIGDKNQEEFSKLVAPFTYTVRLEDCVDMPERTWMVEDVALTETQRRMLEQIKKELRVVMKDTTHNMPSVLQRITRTQQIACGFIPIVDLKGKVLRLQKIPENRTAALEGLLDRTRGKVVVWSRFSYCIDRLHKHFGAESVRFRGGMDGRELANAEKRFEKDDKCRILFAQGKKAGTGHNWLKVARQTIYWSSDHNAQTRVQTERRTWRLGQGHACVYTDLIAEGTYDAKIRDALLRRQSVSADILGRISDWYP